MRTTLVAVAMAALSLNTWGQGIDYAKIEILTEKIAPKPVYTLRLRGSRSRP